MTNRFQNSRKGSTKKALASNLPSICANCTNWSWKNGCEFDRDAAPSKTCKRFKLGKYASYAVNKKGKVMKVDPKTWTPDGEVGRRKAAKKEAADWVAAELMGMGLVVIDERNPKNGKGYLWMVGGFSAVMQELAAKMEAKGATFVYEEDGCEKTGGRPAWRMEGFPEQR